MPEFQTKDNRLLRIEQSEYKGTKYIKLAHMWRSDENDDWKFSKQVINVPIELAPELEEAVHQVCEEVQELVHPDEHTV
jgi:hypothetical protein